MYSFSWKSFFFSFSFQAERQQKTLPSYRWYHLLPFTYLCRKRCSAIDTACVSVHPASALKSLYEMGIVHRDLKPQNILLCHSGRPNPHPSEIVLKIGSSDRVRPELSWLSLRFDICLQLVSVLQICLFFSRFWICAISSGRSHGSHFVRIANVHGRFPMGIWLDCFAICNSGRQVNPLTINQIQKKSQHNSESRIWR